MKLRNKGTRKWTVLSLSFRKLCQISHEMSLFSETLIKKASHLQNDNSCNCLLLQKRYRKRTLQSDWLLTRSGFFVSLVSLRTDSKQIRREALLTSLTGPCADRLYLWPRTRKRASDIEKVSNHNMQAA